MTSPHDPAQSPPTRRALREAARGSTKAVRSATAKSPGRAGRDLRSAVGVGIGLGLLVLVPLLWYPPAMAAILVGAAGVAMHEIVGAVRHAKMRVPIVPVAVAGLAMPAVTYLYHGGAMALTFVLGCLAVLVWRVASGVTDAVRDVSAGVLTLAYVPLLTSFASLMLADSRHGNLQVIVFLLVTVCSDIGGYAVGVLAGKHPMAPSVSPKKSWEGFAGSVVTCAVVGALAVALVLDGPWWVGALLGIATALTATLGDLSESVIKRDIGIKDMGSLLPGHGGLMDRMDSLLVAAPMAWLVLAHLLPQMGTP